jgi:CRP-like cAMP-binding protein
MERSPRQGHISPASAFLSAQSGTGSRPVSSMFTCDSATPQARPLKPSVHAHAFRTAPLPFQDAATFHERRAAVVDRRREQHVESVEEVVRKWQQHDDAIRLREEFAAGAAADDHAGPNRLEAWAAPLLLAVHFRRAWLAAAEELRATNSLRFFLMPLCLNYLQSMRRRLALRRTMEAAAASGHPLERPTTKALRASSPMLAKWPEASLQALSAVMQPRFFFAGNVVFLRGELTRAAFVHFLERGLVSVPDHTEHPPTSVTSSLAHSTSFHGDISLSSSPSGSPRHGDSHHSRSAPVRYIIAPSALMGEYAVCMSENFRDSFIARTDCVTYAVDAVTFLRIVEELPQNALTEVIAVAKARFKRRVQQSKPLIEELRASSPLFAGWPNEPLLSCLDAAMPTVMRPGERIFKDGRTTQRLFFLQRGRVALAAKGAPRATVTPGATIGTEAIIPTTPPAFGEELAATAVTYCEMWTMQRADVAGIMSRYGLVERVEAEYNRAVRPMIPRPSLDVVRKPSVFNFLPDKSAAAIVAALKPHHLAAGSVVARQDLVVAEFIVVVWGSLQLVVTEARTRERKAVGELNVNVAFGAAEVIAQATSNVTVIAQHSAIIFTCTREDVYNAIDLGGHNLFVSVLERANQLVGSRSAEARARLEEEMSQARKAAERAEDPEQRVEDAKQRAYERLRAVRAAEAAEAEKTVSKQMLEHRAQIAKLTSEAKRNREIQRLAVEHRVFACIKNQVYGGKQNEHTELLSAYYKAPVDENEPVFAPSALAAPLQAAVPTGGVFAVDEDGNLVVVDDDVPSTTTARSVTPQSQVATKPPEIAPSGARLVEPATQLVLAAPTFMTTSPERDDGAVVLVPQGLRPTQATTKLPPSHSKAVPCPIEFSDPFPNLTVPVKQPQPPTTRPPDGDRAQRDLLNNALRGAATQRRTQPAPPRPSDQWTTLFDIFPQGGEPAPTAVLPQTARPAVDVSKRHGELPPLPKSSRLVSTMAPTRPLPDSAVLVAAEQPSTPDAHHTVHRRPLPLSRDAQVGISMPGDSPVYPVRAVGGRVVGRIAKGAPGHGIVPRNAPPPPIPTIELKKRSRM